MALTSFRLKQQVLVGHDVYVFRVGCNCDATAVAAATSENSLGLFDPSSLTALRTLDGHGDMIEDVTFFQSSPHCLASCSRDGTSRLWDLRAAEASGCARTFQLKTEEAYTCSVGRGDGALACGAGEKVHLFDVGQGKRLTVYKDCHTDTVNHVRFHPVDTSRLLTGSVDNLIALMNTDEPREDAALLGVIPNEECVQSFTLVGPDRSTLCSVSTTEQVRIWGLGSEDFGIRRAEFLGMRDHPLLSREDSVGYVVETFYDQPSQQVFVLAGTGEDSAGARDLLLFRVGLPEPEPVATFTPGEGPEFAGHTGMVRSAICMPGGTIITAGEDGLICAYREEATEAAPAVDSAAGRFALEPTAYAARRGPGASSRSTPY